MNAPTVEGMISPKPSPPKKFIFGGTPGAPSGQGKWHLNSTTNKMLLDKHINSIMSLKLDEQARRIIL